MFVFAVALAVAWAPPGWFDCCYGCCVVGWQVCSGRVAVCSGHVCLGSTVATVAEFLRPMPGSVVPGCRGSRRGSSTVMLWAPLSLSVVVERCGGNSVDAVQRLVGRGRSGVGLSRTLLEVERVRWHAAPAGVGARRGGLSRAWCLAGQCGRARGKMGVYAVKVEQVLSSPGRGSRRYPERRPYRKESKGECKVR